LGQQTSQYTRERLSAPIIAAGHETGTITARFIALVRYTGQSDTVEVPFVLPCDPDQLGVAFMARHKKLYGFATHEAWQFETLRLTVTAPSRSDIADLAEIEREKSTTPILIEAGWFDNNGPVSINRFERGALPVNFKVKGPAIVEDDWSTIVIPPGAKAWIDSTGHLIIDTGVASCP